MLACMAMDYLPRRKLERGISKTSDVPLLLSNIIELVILLLFIDLLSCKDTSCNGLFDFFGSAVPFIVGTVAFPDPISLEPKSSKVIASSFFMRGGFLFLEC